MMFPRSPFILLALFTAVIHGAALPDSEAAPNDNFNLEARGSEWAEFCNDDNCSEGCGQSVDLSNPGCLAQSGRGSVRFHGFSVWDYALLWSPGSTCDCQEKCVEGFRAGSSCYKLSDKIDAKSFRFVRGGCGGNNC